LGFEELLESIQFVEFVGLLEFIELLEFVEAAGCFALIRTLSLRAYMQFVLFSSFSLNVGYIL